MYEIDKCSFNIQYTLDKLNAQGTEKKVLLSGRMINVVSIYSIFSISGTLKKLKKKRTT